MSAGPSMELGWGRLCPVVMKEAEDIRGLSEAGLEQENVPAMEMARLDLSRVNAEIGCPLVMQRKKRLQVQGCSPPDLPPFSRPHCAPLLPKGQESPREQQLSHVTDSQGLGT